MPERNLAWYRAYGVGTLKGCEWCAKGVRLDRGFERQHVVEGLHLADWPPCTRPSDVAIVAELGRLLEESQKDTERLTHWEANPQCVGYGTGYVGSSGSWFWRRNSDKAHIDASSLRAALDAAKVQAC